MLRARPDGSGRGRGSVRSARGERRRLRELEARRPAERVGRRRAPAIRDPGLRDRHQRRPGRDGPLQGRHDCDATTASTSTASATTAGPARARSPTVQPSAALPQSQPDCLIDAGTGLVDCGNWAVSASWVGPGGRGLRHLLREARPRGRAGGSEPHRLHRARRRRRARTSCSRPPTRPGRPTTSTAATASTPASPGGRAYKVSYNRPFTTRGRRPEDWVFNAEYPMVRWLERNGYDVSYFTGVDTRSPRHARSSSTRSSSRSATTSTGRAHSARTSRRRVTAGVHLAFFSGNEVFWKTRWEPSIDGSDTTYRTLVSYKETHADAKIDPLPNVWTGHAGAIRASARPPTAAARRTRSPARSSWSTAARRPRSRCRRRTASMRFWRNTSVATSAPEASQRCRADTLGYEWDEDLDNGFRPPGLFRLSTTIHAACRISRTTARPTRPGRRPTALTLYRAPERRARVRRRHGSVVVGPRRQARPGQRSTPDAGCSRRPSTCSPTWASSRRRCRPGSYGGDGLDRHDARRPRPITSPTDGGTVVAAARHDHRHGDRRRRRSRRRRRGLGRRRRDLAAARRAARAGRYTGLPGAAGLGDDQEPGGRRQRQPRDARRRASRVTVGAAASCPCTHLGTVAPPAARRTRRRQSVELGVKFRSDVAGFVTGIRFYKGPQHGHARRPPLDEQRHAASATATFTDETASGWQEVTFASPGRDHARTRRTSPRTTRPSGDYAVDDGYFAVRRRRQPAAARPRRTATDGANGVYRVRLRAAFPTETFKSSNYWVDVVFDDDRRAGHDRHRRRASVTPTPARRRRRRHERHGDLQRAMDAATITRTTFELRDASNALVPAAVTYDARDPPCDADPNAASHTRRPTRRRVDRRRRRRQGRRGQRAGGRLHLVVHDRRAAAAAARRGPGRPDPRHRAGGESVHPLLRGDPARRGSERVHGRRTSRCVTAATLGALRRRDPRRHVAHRRARSTMLTDWVDRRRQPDRDAARQAARAAARPHRRRAGRSRTPTCWSTRAAPPGRRHRRHRRSSSTATRTGTRLDGATTRRDALLERDDGDRRTRPSRCGASARTAARPRRSRSTSPARSSTRARATRPGRARSATGSAARHPLRRPVLRRAAGDPQPDWVDLNKVAIPQADEQQRLLANLIGHVNRDRKPLPRFWYFPRGEKAVVVMTGDDHGARRHRRPVRAATRSASPPGCSSPTGSASAATSYIYHERAARRTPRRPRTTPRASRSRCTSTPDCARLDARPRSRASTRTSSATSRARYPEPPGAARPTAPTASRGATGRRRPKVELAHGIRLDTNYYYWPAAWIQDRPGFFTGSGMPMRFADLDGTLIDVYQAATQMTDESGQSYPFTINALLDKALGARGLLRRLHDQHAHRPRRTTPGRNAIVASALARGVPVVSARQMLTWLDGRNGSSFGSIGWNGNTLTFTIAVGAGANGLRAMVPTSAAVGALTGITRDGDADHLHDADDQGRRVRVLRRERRRLRGDVRRRHDGAARSPTSPRSPTATAPRRSPGRRTSRRPRASTTAPRRHARPEPVEATPRLVTSHSVDADRARAEHDLLLPRHLRRRRRQRDDSAAAGRRRRASRRRRRACSDTTVADFGAGTTGRRHRGRRCGRRRGHPEAGRAGRVRGYGAARQAGSPTSGARAGSVSVVAAARHGRRRADEHRRFFGPGARSSSSATFGGGPFASIGFGDTFDDGTLGELRPDAADGNFYARTNDGAGRGHTTLPTSLHRLAAPLPDRLDTPAAPSSSSTACSSRTHRRRVGADASDRQRLRGRRADALGRLAAAEPVRGERNVPLARPRRRTSPSPGAACTGRARRRPAPPLALRSDAGTRRCPTGAGPRSRRFRARARRSAATRATSSTRLTSRRSDSARTPELAT